AWTGWAAAALVLLAVGLGSFLHYSKGPDGGAVVKKPKDDPEERPNPDGGLVKNDNTPKPPPKDEPTPPDEEPDDPDRDPPAKAPDKPATPTHKPSLEKVEEAPV